MSTFWRMKLVSSGTWTPVRMVSFDTKDQMEVAEFGLQGRPYSGVVAGRLMGMAGSVKMLVRSLEEDEAASVILKAGQNINLESSIGQAWVVRVLGDIDRNQNLTRAYTGGYLVKHEYFLEFKIAESG